MLSLKIAGSALIIFATTIIGYFCSQRSVKRADDLQEMKKALIYLRNEIRFVATPFQEAAAAVAEKTLRPVSDIFTKASQLAAVKSSKNAFEIWETAIMSAADCSYFSMEDRSAFISMGKTLGCLDKDSQMQSIDIIIEYINENIAAISKNVQKETRMYQSLGVLCGLFIVVVLI